MRIRVCFVLFFTSFFFFFSTTLSGMQDLGSPTRERTCSLCSGSIVSQPLDHKGSPSPDRFWWHFPGVIPGATRFWWETWLWSLGWEDPLEEGMATPCSILACRIPMDRGTWQATVLGVTKSRIWLSNWASSKQFWKKLVVGTQKFSLFSF